MLAKHRSMLVVVALLCGLVPSQNRAADQVPADGLRLHLDAARGVQVVDGRVAAWSDQSGAGHVATLSDEYAAPTYVADSDVLNGRPTLSFHDRQLLKLSGRVLPADTRCLTVVAVAQAQGPNGVGIFSARHESVPLIQLDTDSHGAARFIIRDTQHRTLQSLGRSYFGRWGVYTGVLGQTDDGQGQIESFFGSQPGSIGRGPFSTPIAGDVHWIGALPLGDRLLSWNGAIAEILVYDRNLPPTERERLGQFLCAKYGLNYKLEPSDLAAQVYSWKTVPRPADQALNTDVCVVGAGSAGVGAALAAARKGAKVVLVERQQRIGGTGVNAFVSCWEPGPGCSIAREIFDRMSCLPNATGVARKFPNLSTSFPMGQWYITPEATYQQTLRRAGMSSESMRCVPYDPAAFDRVVRELLRETGNVTVLDRTTFFHAEAVEADKRVASVLAEGPEGGVTRIRAKIFIDCTGCVHLCRAIGCEVMLGADPRERFDEPSAPEHASLELNAISRCYMIRPGSSPRQEPPIEAPVPYFPKCAHVTGWPDGRRVVNPLPMLPGRALIDYGYERCMEITDKAARAHWRWLQGIPDFAGYEFDRAAPMLGIRESYRVVSRYVLTEHDLAAGLSGQRHDDIIAIADHPCDIHGDGGHLKAVSEPYGVPYRCLIPAGNWENLLVACRGSGFSKIAASSCRLQRTMIQLGHAAGVAAAMAVESSVPVEQIDVDMLARELDAKARYPVAIAGP